MFRKKCEAKLEKSPSGLRAGEGGSGPDRGVEWRDVGRPDRD